jgi:arginine/lysine/ornithine decarboxylase
MNHLKTPLFDQLVLHSEKQPISFHVPGHKNGSIFPQKGQDYFHSLLKLDMTELTGLDDLHSPEGIIFEAEALLAELYRTIKSFFLVNGSTAGNLAMILATLNKDDHVLVQRNSHKSIMNGIRLANAQPVYLYPEYVQGPMVASGVSLETVRTAIKKYPQAKALILTYPNYYGMVYNLEEIIKLAHEHQIPVLIDEAHGVHFISGEPFPQSALTLGADVVVQSAHKTLPAMTMGAFLHYNSSLVSIEKMRYYLQVLQSSSPSYPIMASLDLARSYLATFDKQDINALTREIEVFRDELNSIEGLSVSPVGNGDPLKMIVQSSEQMTGFDLQKRFEMQGVFQELADPLNVLFVLPLLKEGMPFPFKPTVQRIKRAVEAKVPFQKIAGIKDPSTLSKIITPAVTFEEMLIMKTTFVPLLEAKGRICAETIIPYPPGIPLFLPGEKIQATEINHLMNLLRQGAKVQGGERVANQEICVFL